MKESIWKYMELFELLPDAVLVVDEKGVIIECNGQTLPVLGYDSQELKGKTLDILIPVHLHDRHKMHMVSYSTDQQIRKMGHGLKLQAKRKDGANIDVDIALAPLETETKQYTLAVIRDISARLSLDKKIGSLERIKGELEKFAMVVSHDLKSPLQRVKALVHLITLKLSAAENAEIKEMVGYLNESILTMEELIYGILDYARTDNDETFENVDLNKVFVAVKQNVIIPENFRIEVRKPLPQVSGNYTKLFQVFLNLITNAIKYNNKPEGLLSIDWCENETEYTFQFADNGIVVPAEKRNDIFKLFHRVKEEKGKESHGVGLSIVKKIIQQAGGTIWYEESSFGGSCFTFSLAKK